MVSNGRRIVAIRLNRVARGLERVAHPLSYAVHRVGAVILAGMMLLVAVAVIMRYVFNRPILGDLEVVTFMLVVLISFSFAYCGVIKGHVSVTIVVARLPSRLQAIISVLMNLLTLTFLILISWYSVAQALVLWHRGTATIIFKVPMFPFALVLAFGSAVFALVMAAELLDSLAKTSSSSSCSWGHR